MNTSEHSPNTPGLASTLIRVSLWSAMPVTLLVFGGPTAIWATGGYTVRIILSTALFPSLVCSLGAAESAARSVCIAAKNSFQSNDPITNFQRKEHFRAEIRRLSGMTRATLFPISGWAVVGNLPVKDYIVYNVPIKVTKKAVSVTFDGIWFVSKNVNKLLNKIHFWEGLEMILTPPCKAIKWTCTKAYDLVEWGLDSIRG